MYYDDSARRLNLLSGLVFGTVLGAGLALLFLPGERMDSGRRVVVRAARAVGRSARGGMGAARDGVEAAGARAGRTLRERLAELHARDGDDGDGVADAADAAEPEAPRAIDRAEGLARRRFTL
ncbi:hypothetical protein [Longimicrobium sp.]|uniref:hypothetical protein n=1 Tax=Longimicrobium sp. TaxID=2029185 RepID=UPI002C6FD961|nr:hypothetical protein [Longimicrobium sp.]HSU12982.1 hypothetical protein [Longimicrobium sp.]